MAYGVETYVGGIPCIQTVQPFNLVYAVKVINLKPTVSGNPAYIIPIVTGSAGDGELIMTMGDLGYYDKIVDLGGTLGINNAGARMEQTNDQINVYNDAGQLVVRLGELP